MPMCVVVRCRGRRSWRKSVLGVAVASLLVSSCSSARPPSPPRTQSRAYLAEAQEASDQRLAKRCGWEYVDRLKERKLVQQENLKTAGLTLDDQAQKASKLLISSTSGSERYIAIIGLSFADERKSREEFLSLVGATSADMRKENEFTLGSYGLFYNAYLQEKALLLHTEGCKEDRRGSASGP